MIQASNTSAAKLNFVSLFSGCGGLDLGLIQAGFTPIAAFDVWPLAIENYKKNIGNHAYVWDLSNGELPNPINCDIVVAGSPCQGFSTVGKRKIDDPRNSLLESAIKIGIEIKPRAMVFENVLGALQGEHKIHWENAILKLEAAKYKTQTLIIDARDIGSPQTRKRAFLLAWKKNLKTSPNFEIQKTHVALGDVLSNIQNLNNHEPKIIQPATREYFIAKKIMPGQKLCNVRGGSASVYTWSIPEVFGDTTREEKEILHSIMKLRRKIRRRNFGDADPVTPRNVFLDVKRKVTDDIASLIKKGYLRKIEKFVDLKNTFNGKYRRPLMNGSSHTVDSRFGDPKCFLHPLENRGFSVREAARIQRFPDTYVFHGPLDEQFRLVGNAVPPPMGLTIGNMIRDMLLEENHEHQP